MVPAGGRGGQAQALQLLHSRAHVAGDAHQRGRRVGSVSGVAAGWAETFGLTTPPLPGNHRQADYDYRTGVLKWALPQGLWGILRVRNGCN